MNELSKNLVCIVIRGGIEIWVERDRSEAMVSLLTSQNPPQFVKYEQRLINRADVVGIFTAGDMENTTRRKNGGWQCKESHWHEKGEKCECVTLAQRNRVKSREEAIEACGKCTNGWIAEGNRAAVCDCLKNL